MIGGRPHRHAAGRLFILRELVRRELQGRYAGSTLGFFWSFVQPLAQVLLLTFVFSTIIRVPADSRWPHVGFAAWLFAGLLPWLGVQEGVLRSVTAMTDNAGLVKKLRFPRDMLVLSVVIAALVHQAVAALVFITLLAASQTLAPGGLPLLLVAVPLQLALTLGMGLLGAAAHVFFRDLGQMLGVVFMTWFYVTPIVYPLRLAPEPWRDWLAWNPLTPLVELYRQAFFGGNVKTPEGMGLLIVAAAIAVLVGLGVFGWLEPVFADEV
jgi:ABC-type polysaccharide/polyol phosphate export permease